ncbi:MAG TPA: AraC family transcriptional regulator [Anaerolineales bacterium]|nr:AraC family transcriptional regulator [Anaerolineales bacterium]
MSSALNKLTFPDLKIYIRRTQSRPPGQLGELHFHPHYEIVWLDKGKAEFFCDFQRYPLPASTLAFVRPGNLHTWFGDWTQFQLDVVGFQPDVLGLWPHLPQLPFFKMESTPFWVVPEPQQPILSALFDGMLQRSKQTDGDSTLLAGYLYVLLLEISRLYAQQIPNNPSSPAQTLVSHFRHLLETHYKERWQIGDYANALAITPNHLVKTIRQTTGQTPGQMAQERLFLEARRLLAYSNSSIQILAQELGFSSPAQFGQWFKKVYGAAPSQFRQQISQQFSTPE